MRHCYLLLIAVLLFGIRGSAQLTATNLPIISITSGATPIGDTQVLVNMKVIDNTTGLNHPADAPQYNGNIGLKLRGNAAYAKKSYTIEVWTTFKNEIDTPLLGMPSDNDWVLMAAYPDRSLMRSLLTYQLYDNMGHYAPRMKLCELMVNGAYMGVYLFGENIKRESSRVSITKLLATDNAGTAITGGYILEVDESNDGFFQSLYTPPYRSAAQTIRYHYEYPADNKITGIQKAWIHGYVDSFENALNSPAFQDTTVGWRGFGAHTNFEDFFITNELTGNEEAYRLHSYFYKDRLKKLRPASPWETDLTFNNTASCNGSKDTAWMYRHAQYCPADVYLPSFWWYRLQSDTQFVKDVKCRYSELRNTLLDTGHVFARIDSMNTYINAQGAVARNFTQWPIWSTPIVNEPQPMTQNYAEEILRIKTYYKKRLQFLDSKWLTTCAPTGVAALSGIVQHAVLFPNPVDEMCTVRFSLLQETGISLHVRNMLGQELYNNGKTFAAGVHDVPVSMQSFPSGWYTVSLEAAGLKPVVLKVFRN